MIFQLVVNVCLIDAPASCHTEYLTSTAPSLSQCLGDMPSLAKFISDHPKFVIRNWHCNREGKKEADL
jgi:hypothetical protein